MKKDLQDITAFLAVVEAGGFRESGRLSGVPASSLIEAMRRLEARLGVRLLHRTTRCLKRLCDCSGKGLETVLKQPFE